MNLGFDPSGLLLGFLPLSIAAWAGQMLVYHGIGYGFDLCDRYGLLQSFKVRRREKLSHVQLLPRVLANQVFILLPAMVFTEWLGLAFTGAPHLSLWRFLIDMALMGLGHDLVQYAAHRGVLHRAGLCGRLGHGVHHSTGAGKAISACFMSRADFFLEIVLPYLVPLVAVGGGGADIFFHLTIAGLGAFGGLYEHSGYDFAVHLPQSTFAKAHPRLSAFLAHNLSSKAHGEHHTRGTVSFSDGFGSPGMCDTLFGTRWDKAAPKVSRAAQPETSAL